MSFRRFIFCSLILTMGHSFAVSAVIQQTPEQQSSTSQPSTQPIDEAPPAIEAMAWLKLVDENKFEESWDAGSPTMQMIMKQKEWVKYLDKVRKPLGKMTTRNLLDLRLAKDPQGVPAGNYTVLIYQTAFADKPKATELLILSEGHDGHWRPMSYFIK